MKKNKLSTKDIQNALSDKSSVASDIIKDKKKTDGLIKKALATMEKVPGIGKYVDEIKYMCAMVRDYVKRDYTEVKLSTIIAVVASLVYLVSPVDIIPDYIPVVGYLDDMAVLAYAIKATYKEIEAYKLWRNMQNLKAENAVEENFEDIGNPEEVDETADSDDVQLEPDKFEQVISNGNEEDWDAGAYDDGADE
jgi:uncharacterized membrane protein YkvA (DUF1232 family)